MRILSLAAVTTFVVIAACSDVASPIAAGSDVGSLTAAGGAAHFLGGKTVRPTSRRSTVTTTTRRPEAECEDDDRDHHDHWGKRRPLGIAQSTTTTGASAITSVFSRGKHGFSGHMLSNHDEDGEDCGGGGDGDSPERSVAP